MERSGQRHATTVCPRQRNLAHVEKEAEWTKEPVWTFWRHLFGCTANCVFANAYPIENAPACSEIGAVSLLRRRGPVCLKLRECGDGRMSNLVGP